MPPSTTSDVQDLVNQKNDTKNPLMQIQPKLFSKLMVGFLIVWIIGLFIAIQLVGVYVFTPYVYEYSNMSATQRFALGSFNGTVTSYAMLLTFIVLSVVIFGMVLLKVSIRRKKYLQQCYKSRCNNLDLQKEIPVSKVSVYQQTVNYLAIRPFSQRIALGMFALWAIFLLVSEAVTSWLDKNPSAFVDVLYDSANPRWLLMFVMIVVAPMYEELMFRGILWSALKEQLTGKKGVWLASIVTSLLFALIHFQYDWYEMSVIFFLALLLSFARSRSGSLLLPISIHIANNGIAMWQYLTFIK